MTGGVVVRKRTRLSRTKVKTGCATCRIRKIKCDETKPSCRKCSSTGRTCDGYESLFRPFVQSPISGAPDGHTKSVRTVQRHSKGSNAISLQDIDLLNHLFHTKTSFDVKLDCDEEAKQVLQASQTDPLIRHALSSLRALREDFDLSKVDSATTIQQTPSHDDGVQHYCMALRGLASNISSSGSNGLKSALLCCQMFISIEQVKENYIAMIQHLIQGIEIMHEYRARPSLITRKELAPSYHHKLPLLDVFVVKLFIAPCKFANEQVSRATSDSKAPVCSTLPTSSTGSGNLRPLAPDIKAKLTKIATSALTFLDKVAQLKTCEEAVALLLEKISLLDNLDTWLNDLEVVQAELNSFSTEHLSVTFKRLFHQILKVIILGTLEYPPDVQAKLRAETDRLLDMACYVTEGVKTWRECGERGAGISY